MPRRRTASRSRGCPHGSGISGPASGAAARPWFPGGRASVCRGARRFASPKALMCSAAVAASVALLVASTDMAVARAIVTHLGLPADAPWARGRDPTPPLVPPASGDTAVALVGGQRRVVTGSHHPHRNVLRRLSFWRIIVECGRVPVHSREVSAAGFSSCRSSGAAPSPRPNAPSSRISRHVRAPGRLAKGREAAPSRTPRHTYSC